MGYETDCLRIVSINAAGRNGRKFVFQHLIEQEKPEIVFLPGDNSGLDTLAQTRYQYLLDPAFKEPVFLYDSTRLKVNQLPVRPQSSRHVCDFDKVLAPLIDINSPAPAQNIVKQFICVNWHWKLSENGGSQVLYENRRMYMMFVQNLAYFTGKEVLIGGDFNLPESKIKELIEEHNSLIQHGIDSIKPQFQKFGYMFCMTEEILRSERRLLQLKLHKTNNSISTETNYFVASKEMQLFETRHEKIENISYRYTRLQLHARVETDYHPEPTYTKTHIYIPQRPPKHHGG
ncbi:uncharacterized protein LOC133173411 [Saccostrea echinata]|uniref:uncharacterized protein LOC133173411 n=1 Tax=Saccostrea echinata TaxID=191078 RepID=UPI002A80917B|nr:uncharacterized protein LOC133173411 [Saccostrea echinata]